MVQDGKGGIEYVVKSYADIYTLTKMKKQNLHLHFPTIICLKKNTLTNRQKIK